MKCLSLALALVGVFTVSPCVAQEPWHHGYGWHEHWREGHWVHAWRGGREGWWWVVDGNWYFYPAPIYPYPEPQAVIVAPAPGPAAPSQPPSYYYCSNPVGYYPAVTQCQLPWQPVAMAPPQAAAPPPPPPPGAPPPPALAVPPPPAAASGADSLLSAFAGHPIAAALDDGDRLAARSAERAAFTSSLGQMLSWSNPANGHSGSITPTRDGVDSNGNKCREIQQTLLIGSQSDQVTTSACHQADGSWRPQ